MVLVKNLFGFTKSWVIGGKEYVFKALETRWVDGVFENKDHSPRFQGTVIVKRMDREGIITTPSVTKNRAEKIHNKQKYVSIFEKDGKKCAITKFEDFCNDNNLNFDSIRVYMQRGVPYYGWTVTKIPLKDFDDKYDKETLELKPEFREKTQEILNGNQ